MSATSVLADYQIKPHQLQARIADASAQRRLSIWWVGTGIGGKRYSGFVFIAFWRCSRIHQRSGWRVGGSCH
jgi:hypothetical protein